MTMTAQITASIYRKLVPVLGHDDTNAFLTALAEMQPPPVTDKPHPDGIVGKLGELREALREMDNDLTYLKLEVARLQSLAPGNADLAGAS